MTRLVGVKIFELTVTRFPGGSDSKESACSAGDLGLIPGLGRSPGVGNGNPLQYSYLGNPMRKSQTEESGGLQSMGSQSVRHNRVSNALALAGRFLTTEPAWEAPN